ncbi:hypothetical protein [Streptoalloteichus hindustanus]|uniref:FtsX extracellular domain-containing protein n=1 Tax=Streptoalloteichus hindustanus TaxID=2017 RepID=A0A1M5PEL5_STRHI|nr:hypothetical protein [Streptoalloteichus hindustanus]SHH00216.1 hypothetical protein SAMN05444320_11832 [Streptoalloteichus hindustanus]
MDSESASESAEDQVPSTPEERPRLRRRGREVVLALTVLVVAVAVAGTSFWRFVFTEPPEERSPEPVPLADHPVCGAQLRLSVKTDEEMVQVARIMSQDPRSRRVFYASQKENYAWFQRIFAEHKDLLAFARPEALPASVWLLPMRDVDLKAWGDDLRRQLPQLVHVQPVIPEELVREARARGQRAVLPPCPSSGEWPSAAGSSASPTK